MLQDPGAGIPLDADLATAPDLVGLTHILTSPVESCSNCDEQSREHLVTRNAMFMTSQLHDYVKIYQLQSESDANPEGLESLRPEHVVPFLKERLRWRIITAKGRPHDPRALSNENQFRIRISSRKTILGDESVEPVFEYYDDIVPSIIRAAGPGHTSAATVQGS